MKAPPRPSPGTSSTGPHRHHDSAQHSRNCIGDIRTRAALLPGACHGLLNALTNLVFAQIRKSVGLAHLPTYGNRICRGSVPPRPDIVGIWAPVFPLPALASARSVAPPVTLSDCMPRPIAPQERSPGALLALLLLLLLLDSGCQLHRKVGELIRPPPFLLPR